MTNPQVGLHYYFFLKGYRMETYFTYKFKSDLLYSYKCMSLLLHCHPWVALNWAHPCHRWIQAKPDTDDGPECGKVSEDRKQSMKNGQCRQSLVRNWHGLLRSRGGFWIIAMATGQISLMPHRMQWAGQCLVPALELFFFFLRQASGFGQWEPGFIDVCRRPAFYSLKQENM